MRVRKLSQLFLCLLGSFKQASALQGQRSSKARGKLREMLAVRTENEAAENDQTLGVSMTMAASLIPLLYFQAADVSSTNLEGNGRALPASHAPCEPCSVQKDFEPSDASSGTQDEGEDDGSAASKSPQNSTSQPSFQETHDNRAAVPSPGEINAIASTCLQLTGQSIGLSWK